MIRLSCSMVSTTRILARPASERFAKSHDAFQVMKNRGNKLAPIFEKLPVEGSTGSKGSDL